MQNLKVKMLSVAIAALTAATPILSSYVAYASDITVNDDGTVTQISTSTDEKTDETKFLFVNLKTVGGKVVINEGEDSEQTVRLEKQMDRLHIDVYDKDDVMISSENAIDNGYTYAYEAKADDAVNVKAYADDGYVVKLYELTDDSSGTEIAEDVGFDAGNKVEAFKYPVFMEYDKTVKIGFEKKGSAEDIAEDLSVNDETDEAGKEVNAKAEEAAGNKEEIKVEADVDKPENSEAEDVKADEEAATKVRDDKKAEDADAPEKSEDLKDIDSNDKQNVSEEIAVDNDLTVNTDDNKKDNEESDITVNDSSIAKDIDENAGEEPDEKSSEDIMNNDGDSEDAKDADSDNSDENFVSDEASDSADKDTTINDAETEETEKAKEADSHTDNTEDKIENDKQDTEQSYDISNLDNTSFASARLVVISDNAESVSTDSKYIIANYQNIYLIQYETVEDAMKAYVKYGKIKYDRKHLADNDARFKGKVPASDEMFTTAADINKTALPVCELHIKEYLAPDGYNKDSKVHVIVIKALRDNNQKFTDKNAVADNTPTIEDPVAGDKWRIRVQAKKIDENGKGLTGAKFDIYDSEDCSGKPLATITSKDDGTTNIETIDNIPQTTETYEVWCKEVQAPPGYAILEIPVKLTFKLADFKKLSVEDQKKGELKIFGLTDGGKGIVNEKGWQVRIQTKKINRDKTPLAGAVFTIYSDEACKDADAITTITSGDDGMTDIAKILVPNSEQEKTFYCKETKAPQGKIIKETVFPLTFKKADYTAPDGELKTFGPKEGIINDEGWKVRVNAKKVDGDKKGLAGAKFTVYDNESLSNESILGVLESSADGTTNELSLGFNMNITEVTLYCQETTPPDGYIGTDEIFKVTFKKADYDKLKVQDANTKGELKTFSTGIVNVSVTPTPTISVTPTPPTPPSGGLYVKKTSKAPKDIMDLKSYTLANAEYRVTSSRAGDMGILTTDESGYSNVLSLPDNSIPHHLDAVYDIHGNLIQEAKDWIEKVQTTYYITEIKAPNYHSVYAGTKSQSVVMPDDAGQTFEIPFENEPIFCDGKLDIEKLGVKGEVVVGAVFKVEYFDADGPNESDLVRTWYLKSDTQGHVRMDEAHLDKNNQSDDFFKYDGNIVIPIGGYLQITEVDAPAEYVVETEPVGIATTKDADFKLTYDNAKAWYEELERCRVNLKKYEADGKTPIAGVEFEIKFLKQAIVPTSKMHPNFKRLLKEGESTIRHTDENGDVFFDNLDQGIYQITEIKTLDGNSLLKEPIIVTLPMTMTEDEANEYGNVNYETAKEDINYSGKWYFYECLYEITNNAVFKMPMTGDDGKWKYGFIGLGIVMAISAGFVICNVRTQKARKRKK